MRGEIECLEDRRMAGNQKGLPQRKSIRLKGYDYSRAGLYFVTLCIQYRSCLFGKIKHGEMILNDAGKMVQCQWQTLIRRFDHIKLSEFIVMPNHVHGIIESVGVPLVGTRNDLWVPAMTRPPGIREMMHPPGVRAWGNHKK